MFRLEKVFQNDDAFFIKISSLLKVISILLSIYIFSILEFKTIYDLFNINIFCYCPKHCFRLIEGQQSAGVGVKISWVKQ